MPTKNPAIPPNPTVVKRGIKLVAFSATIIFFQLLFSYSYLRYVEAGAMLLQSILRRGLSLELWCSYSTIVGSS